MIIIKARENTFALFVPPLLKVFKFQATIFSVFLALWSITTLLVGPLVKLKSERFVAILGNSVLIAGFICSAFSTNTLHLAISIGILIGPAFGLINVNVLLIINTWFEKKAGLAISQSCKMSQIWQIYPCSQK